MTPFRFGQFEVDIDIMDYDFAAKYERLANEIDTKAQAVQKSGPVSEIIKKQCELVFELHESLFGEGTVKLMFGGTTNIRVCDQSMVALAEAIKADRVAYIEESKVSYAQITAGIPNNRQQKRAAQKGGKK